MHLNGEFVVRGLIPYSRSTVLPPAIDGDDGMESTTIRLSRKLHRCTVLGPGTRAVLWVQGCPLRCRGCVAPQTLPYSGGFAEPVEALAYELAALPDIEGITLSGGEPTSQAAALVHLIDAIRDRRDLSVFCYTGFLLEDLRRGSAEERKLLNRVDVLVDGPYVEALHTDLIWRGSSNQTLHFMTPRYRHLEHLTHARGSRLEVSFEADGTVHWAGIPPKGFRRAFVDALAGMAVVLADRAAGERRTTR